MKNTLSTLVFVLMIALGLTLSGCDTAQSPAPAGESEVVTDTLAADAAAGDVGAEAAETGSQTETDADDEPSDAGAGDVAQPVTEDEGVQGPVGLEMPPSWDLDPDAVSIDAEGLGYEWEAVLVPASPYDASQPSGPSGLPEHVEIRFRPARAGAADQPAALAYIVPVREYRAMWDDAGDDTVSERLNSIQEIVYKLPSPPLGSRMPVLPVEETIGDNDLAVRVGRASPNEDSASKDGYRLIGRFTQDAGPVTNDGLRYIYQGFTNDGKHLVAAFFPTAASSLPEDAAAVAEAALQAFEADPEGQVAAAADELTALAASDWEPERDVLNDVVGSLRIDGVPASGLVGPAWEWTGVTYQEDDRPVDDPEAYVIRFAPGGEVFLDSDCRSIFTTYEVVGGLKGGVASELKMVGESDCDPEARIHEFEAGVFIGTDYFVEAGGDTMGIQLPGEGPIHWFRLAE